MAQEAFENEYEQTSIVLWGPTQAGKDWLIQAFVRELEMLNDFNDNFHYRLTENLPGNAPFIIRAQTPSNNPSIGPSDIEYQFERLSLAKNQSREHGITERVGKHKIIIHNNAGGILAKCLTEPAFLPATYQTLTNADNIFLVMGPPSEKQSHSETPRRNMSLEKNNIAEMIEVAALSQNTKTSQAEDTIEDTAFWSAQNYASFLERLFQSFNDRPRNVAICMTKSDLDNFRGEHFSILERRYGPELANIVKIQSRHHTIKTFATTAAGYLGHESNYDQTNGEIKYPNRWKPVGTTYPFFWMFELIERQRLAKEKTFFLDPRKFYIPYPKMKSY